MIEISAECFLVPARPAGYEAVESDAFRRTGAKKLGPRHGFARLDDEFDHSFDKACSRQNARTFSSSSKLLMLSSQISFAPAGPPNAVYSTHSPSSGPPMTVSFRVM